MQKDDSEGDA